MRQGSQQPAGCVDSSHAAGRIRGYAAARPRTKKTSESSHAIKLYRWRGPGEGAAAAEVSARATSLHQLAARGPSVGCVHAACEGDALCG